MRDLADAMAFTYFSRIESFLDGAKKTNRDIGGFYFSYPIVANIRHKNPGEDRTQLFLIGGIAIAGRRIRR